MAGQLKPDRYDSAVVTPSVIKESCRFFLWVLMSLSSLMACRGNDALDTWRLRNTNALNTVRFVGGIFVGVGSQGKVATSPDGTNWTFQTLSTSAAFRGVTYGTNSGGAAYFVVVGDSGNAWKSTDAVVWTKMFSSSLTNSLTDVAWNPQTRVFVASADDSHVRQITYSSTLNVWNNVALPAPPFSSATVMKRVTCVEGTFFAAGGGSFDDHIWKSTNGVNWEYVLYANGYAGNFVFGNGRLAYIANEACPPVFSDLGVTWSTISDPHVCFNGCYLCYMGADAAFGNSTFVIAGYGLSQTQGMLSSTNLAQWQIRTALRGTNIFGIIFSRTMMSIAYGKGTFVVAATDGIWQSEPVSTPGITIEAMPGTNTLLIRASGEVGRGYRLQTSSNLIAWQDFASFTNTWPTMEFPQVPDPNTNVKFYRLVTP